jgi:hypothetical protein
MSLQLLHSEFPYIREKLDFLFYQCKYHYCRYVHIMHPEGFHCIHAFEARFYQLNILFPFPFHFIITYSLLVGTQLHAI